MAAILQNALQGYEFVFEELADPRTKSWPLIAKPYQGILLLGLYLMFVLKWGPQWMKHRKPYNLDKILIVYNALQVIACAFIFVMGIKLGWGWDYRWVCEPVDYSNTPRAILIAKVNYMYFILKVADLLDTVFFVLRKKQNQVTFLHLYHHAGMVALVWGATTYLPGGHATLVGVINCFVHVVMYSYYLLTVAMPSIKNAIWLKKLVTQVQILQFFCCVVHMSTIVFKPDCAYPRWISAVFLPQNFFILVLFTDFYIKTYIRKPKEKTMNSNKIENKGITKNGNGVKYYNNNCVTNGLYDTNNALLKADSNGFGKTGNGLKNNDIYQKVVQHSDDKYKKYE